MNPPRQLVWVLGCKFLERLFVHTNEHFMEQNEIQRSRTERILDLRTRVKLVVTKD